MTDASTPLFKEYLDIARMKAYGADSIPRLHQLVSRIALQFAKLGYTLPAPTPEHLMLAASQVTGKVDWGTDFPYDALHQLFESYRSEANLSPMGRHRFEKMVVERLVNRLEIQDTITKFPDVADRPVHRPLFITGMPRTGTTLLHRLMALDPANRTLKFWETWNPCPPVRPEDCDTNPRIKSCDSILRKLYRSSPLLEAIHRESATGASECIGLLMNSLKIDTFNLFARVPSYLRWLADQDMSATYQYHCLQLQAVSYYESNVRWLLKAPAHRKHFASLMKQYPDARVVVPHRAPLEAVPSLASLRLELLKSNSSRIDPLKLGPATVAGIQSANDAFARARKGIPNNQIFDLSYSRMLSDPVGTVREIYQFAEYDFPDDLEGHILRYLDERPQSKYGQHRYALEQFGLTREKIESNFANYCESFGDFLQE